jgi:uncharacterized protein
MSCSTSNRLCLECGLCCNGVIFADVQLEPADDPARLQSSGLPLAAHQRGNVTTLKFPQPCAALDGCRCRIYTGRPGYCRKFECWVLKRVTAGRLDADEALRLIRSARRRAAQVKRLLRELGDTDEQLALRKRFRRMQKRLESAALNNASAHRFSRLTLAVHDLNVLLADEFYPGKK